MLEGLIFDLDGTITLTEQLHHEAFSEIFKEYGIDFTFEEQVEKYAGTGSRNIFTSVFKERGVTVSEEEIDRCVARKKELYTKIVQESEIPVVAGAKEFIEKMYGKGLKTIIATGNSNLDAVRIILEKVGLSRYFPNILSIAEVSRGKPFPDVFIEAAKRLGLEKSQCVVLEDAINGVEAAKAAGIRCIAFTTSSTREALSQAGADIAVKDYWEITDKILYNE